MTTLKHQKNNIGLGLLLFVTLLINGCSSTSSWQSKLESDLPVLGHRNWIVIADSAYPKQSAAGIETLYTDASQIEVLKKVLVEIDLARHVQAQILVDAEMSAVTEEDAPGINEYRKQLDALFQNKDIDVMLHEEIIKQLDKDAKVFNVLLLKTKMTIPYTSIFLKLDAGYWDADKESRLRDKLKKAR